MLKRLILAVAFMGFVGAMTLPTYTLAQTTTEETKKKSTKKAKTTAKTNAKKKPPTEKQLAARKKFSDCAKTWGDHKKSSGEKGRKAYNAYMGKCLKAVN